MNDDQRGQRTLIGAPGDPARYPHNADRVEVIETHISYVLLAGSYAYKLKKSIDLGFVDFSTPSWRQTPLTAFADKLFRIDLHHDSGGRYDTVFGDRRACLGMAD